MAGTAAKPKTRETEIDYLPAKNGRAWAYFSRSGKTIEIYAKPDAHAIATVIVKLTLKQMLSGNKFLNSGTKKEKQ